MWSELLDGGSIERTRSMKRIRQYRLFSLRLVTLPQKHRSLIIDGAKSFTMLVICLSGGGSSIPARLKQTQQLLSFCEPLHSWRKSTQWHDSLAKHQSLRCITLALRFIPWLIPTPWSCTTIYRLHSARLDLAIHEDPARHGRKIHTSVHVERAFKAPWLH